MKRSFALDRSYASMASSSGRRESRTFTSHALTPDTDPSAGPSSLPTVSCTQPGPADSPSSRCSSVPGMVASSDEPPRRQFLSCLNDIFKCTICFGELTEPHLCPRCSKLYCFHCIDEWLDSGTSQCCPNCKLELRLDQLVKVRWFDDIEKLQRTLRSTPSVQSKETGEESSSQDLCTHHAKPLSFYCASCRQCVCETCATEDGGGRHRDHTFKALQVTYEQHLAVVEGELAKVEHYRDKLASLVDKIDRNVELIWRVKCVKRKELASIMGFALESLQRQEEEKVARLHAHRHNIAGEMDDIERKLEIMRCELAIRSRSRVIQMKPRVQDECNAIRMQTMRDFRQIREPPSLKIEIPVIFETGIFVVHKFSTFDDNQGVYSSEFSDCLGRTWRIMAWCEISEDQFGIYLELVNGVPCWMECTFQLLHDNPSKTISKTIRQYFTRTPQKGWGLQNFASLNTIVEERYLRDNDSLELLYHIRPCSAGDEPASGSPSADETLIESVSD